MTGSLRCSNMLQCHLQPTVDFESSVNTSGLNSWLTELGSAAMLGGDVLGVILH